MRYLLSLLILSVFLVACDDSPTASGMPGSVYRWHVCSDTLTRNLAYRELVLSDGRVISIPKGDTCTAFTADTTVSAPIIRGSLSWDFSIYSGNCRLLSLSVHEMKKGFELDSSLIYGDTNFVFRTNIAGSEIRLHKQSIFDTLEPYN